MSVALSASELSFVGRPVNQAEVDVAEYLASKGSPIWYSMLRVPIADQSGERAMIDSKPRGARKAFIDGRMTKLMIAAWLSMNPGSTVRQIAEALALSQTVVRKMLERLQYERIAVCDVRMNCGHWRVNLDS